MSGGKGGKGCGPGDAPPVSVGKGKGKGCGLPLLSEGVVTGKGRGAPFASKGAKGKGCAPVDTSCFNHSFCALVGIADPPRMQSERLPVSGYDRAPKS